MTKHTETKLTIDIGATSIKVAEFSFPGQKEMVLEKFIYEEYATDSDSTESRLPLLETSLKKILNSYEFSTRKVFLSISGQTTYIRFIKLPPASNQEQQINQLVTFEAKENIPFPLNEVTWDYQLISPLEEDDDEINVMFAVIKNDIINGFINILENNKLQVELVDITPTTFYNAAKANRIGEEDPAMILNIGSFCSTLVFINRNNFYARTIPVAGNIITQQIMKELQIPFEEAETMKKKIGFVALGGAFEENDSESATIISKIIRNIMIRLHSEINRSINVYRSQQKAPAPKKLYLAGGSSIINFTERFLSSKLKIETEYFNPFSIVKIAETVDKNQLASYAHMTAEVIGLGLRHVTTCPIEISLLPKEVSRKYFIKKKQPYVIAACILILFCFLVTYWGKYKEISLLGNTLSERKTLYNIKLRDSRDLKAEKKEKDSLIKEYNEIIGEVINKNYWVDLLNDFQKCLPDNTWITEFQPYSKTETINKPKATIRRTLFGRIPKKNTDKDKKENIEWLKIKGHSLMLHSNLTNTYAENLKKNLLKSKFFSNNPKEITILTYSPVKNPQNNITTFTMDIKLNQKLYNK